ncbi:MAG: leucine-rich repeat protein [Lachnospiraceae bacterium]|nr:leucine-rich repeat protein [Lachnospiraceae bacterium]
MAEYYDDKYLVLDGVLLSYKSEEEYVTVPESIGGMRIHTIGQGAFAFHPLKGVIISEGIERINSNAFAHCHNMKYATVFPSVKTIEEGAFDHHHWLEKIYQVLVYTDSEYKTLRHSCVCDGGSRYLALQIPDIGDNVYLSDNVFPRQGKTHRLPYGIRRLFVAEKDTWGFPLSFDFKFGEIPGLRNIFWPASSKPMDEKEALENVEEEGFPWPDSTMEQMSAELDGKRRWNDGRKEVDRSVVFLFDDRNTKTVNGLHYVLGEYSIGYHFWQSLQKVTRPAKKDLLQTLCVAFSDAMADLAGEGKYEYKRCVLGASQAMYKDRAKMDYISFSTGIYKKGETFYTGQ